MVIPQNVKKSQNHCTLVYIDTFLSDISLGLNTVKDPSILGHPVMAGIATVPPPPSRQNEVEGGVHCTVSAVFTFVTTVYSLSILCLPSTVLCLPSSVLC